MATKSEKTEKTPGSAVEEIIETYTEAAEKVNKKNTETAKVVVEQTAEATKKATAQTAEATKTAIEQTAQVADKVIKNNIELTGAALQQTAEAVEEATEPKTKTRKRTTKTGEAKNGEFDEVEENEAEIGLQPKTFLIPYMLLMLRDSLMHGYAIWEKLMVMGIPGLDANDRASIYRTLRQLEREGKIKSEWDTATEGPARRVYSLTDTGENFLQLWAMGLDQYRQSLDFFFKMYTGGTLPSPFGFKLTGPKYGNKSNSKGEK